MDVTPRELRDVEIREAFRGYNRDEVNDLLERAATAIEALNERARVLGERLASGQGSQGETSRGRSDTEDMLHRTLLLAQRASDEAIAEAEEKARVMLEDAETRSRRMLADAATEARRTTELERQRLEQEIADLQRRNEELTAQIDGLEHFETEYRTRLTSAIESDLHAIERDLKTIRDRSAAMPGDRPAPPPAPAIVEAERAPAGRNDSGATDSGAPDASATMELDMRFLADEKPKPLAGAGNAPPTPTAAPTATSQQSISDAAQAAASEMVGTKAPEAAVDDAAKSAEPATIDLYEDSGPSTVLDDDSFFASLRDAVRDDAPLGPRDAAERTFFDQDDSKGSPTFREAFKRRR